MLPGGGEDEHVKKQILDLMIFHVIHGMIVYEVSGTRSERLFKDDRIKKEMPRHCSNKAHLMRGVSVAVKCSNQKVSTRTNENGYFELEVPANSPSSSSCFAVLLGGPEQLCASKRNMVSKIVKLEASDSYSLATSLTFFTTSCPAITEHRKHEKMVGNGLSPSIGSSKTIGPFAPGAPALPALPPFDFYRFLPIIGIP